MRNGVAFATSKRRPAGVTSIDGQCGRGPIRQYLRWQTQWLHDQMQRGPKRFNEVMPQEQHRPDPSQGEGPREYAQNMISAD